MPFKALKPKKINVERIRRQLFAAMVNRGNRNEKLLEGTTEHFETVKPTFVSEVVREGGDLSVITAPLDDEHGQIWSYLNDGTEVRFAVMEEDFEAKTTPGTFDTERGRGGFSHLDLSNPRDGIEARGWTELLVENEADSFQDNVQRVITSIARRLF